jgi:murein L,D-transpeptidase YcbB/YkuD
MVVVGAALLSLVPVKLFGQVDPAQTAIRQMVEQLTEAGRLQIGKAHIAAVGAIPEFYQRRNFHRGWTNPAAVDDLLRAIDDSEEDGLTPEDYHREMLNRLDSETNSSALSDPQKLADFDVLLTDALLRLCYHLYVGKVDPERLDPDWNFAKDIDHLAPALLIQGAINSGDLYQFIGTLKPQHQYYTELKKVLMRYRSIARSGGWKSVPGGKTLRIGMTDARVPLLRKRLSITGDMEDSLRTDANFFDERLEKAVIRFQRRHVLTADGVVGKNTLKAMNVPVAVRIAQIRVNLERARWVLQDIEDTFVVVNIAGFQVSYIRGGELAWRSRVQVGKPFRKTPVFRSEMKYLVFNPTWTVPPTILSQDILPAVNRDPSYLQQKNIEVLERSGRIVNPATIDWSKYKGNNFPYLLRQRPGPNNALGLVKFIFPNKHLVFLHDTPSKTLFERETRTFSSGCIRVEKPLQLAELLLDDPVKWDNESIAGVIRSGQPKTVYLREPMLVLLLYWTATVDEEGEPIFINDVYDRDPSILEDLNAGFRLRKRDKQNMEY